MKRPIYLALLVTGLLVGPSCTRYHLQTEARYIEDFAQKLMNIIWAKDCDAYGRLLPQRSDWMLNLATGTPAELPINEEALSQNRTEFEAKCSKSLAEIESKCGETSKVKTSEISYFIDKDSNLKKLGILKFNLTIALSGPNGKATVSQPGCVLCKRGVLLAEPFRLIEGPSSASRP